MISTDAPNDSQLYSGPLHQAAHVPGTIGPTGRVAVETTGADGNLCKQID